MDTPSAGGEAERGLGAVVPSAYMGARDVCIAFSKNEENEERKEEESSVRYAAKRGRVSVYSRNNLVYRKKTGGSKTGFCRETKYEKNLESIWSVSHVQLKRKVSLNGVEGNEAVVPS